MTLERRRGGCFREWAEHPAVLPRGQTGCALKQAAEERRVLVADLGGDRLDGR